MLDRIRGGVTGWPRGAKRLVLIAFDFAILGAVVWLAYVLRLAAPFVPSPTQVGLMVLAPVIAVPVFWSWGLYRAVIRFLPERFVWKVIQAMTLATLIWVAVLFLSSMSGIAGVPRSIPVLFWALGIIVVAGTRFAVKLVLLGGVREDAERLPVVIFGAGAEGGQIAAALRSQGGRRPVAFVDADPTLRGTDAFGLPIRSPEDLEAVIDDYEVKEVIFAPRRGDPATRQEIIRRLASRNVRVRTVPVVDDLTSETAVVRQIRDIRLDDLLGRPEVPADPELLRQMIEGRTILVTGAGGSIGSVLARLIARWMPARLVLMDANEFALFEIERHLGAADGIAVVPVLGSVTDRALVERVLATNRIDAVFHAAAHKHVPLLELNALEAIRNNVFGTATMAEAALAAGVGHFVLISSDKAVRPASVMGATKRWAEMIVEDCAARAVSGVFCSVRFGNVLGSSGSVVQLFREQIADGGPVTITHAQMTRYFMSISEAAELIVQAAALSRGGAVMLLDMGEPVPIRVLAEMMIRLAGLTPQSPDNPGGDISIMVTEPRRGEKVSEELFYAPDRAQPTRHAKILSAEAEYWPTGELAAALARLRQAFDDEDEDEARAVLFEQVADRLGSGEPETRLAAGE